MLIFAVIDEFNAPVKGTLAPLAVGLIVVGIARDLGPRLLAWIEGWKSVAIAGDYPNVSFYMWVPIVGRLLGGAIGA